MTRKTPFLILAICVSLFPVFSYGRSQAAAASFVLEKQTFLNDYNSPASTFEPNSEVVALVKILANSTDAADLRLHDYYPPGSNPKIVAAGKVASKCGSNLGDRLGSITKKDGYIEWSGQISKSSFICYSYKILSNPEGKNQNISIERILYKTGTPDEIVATLPTYLMIRGFASISSVGATEKLDIGRSLFPIDDTLLSHPVLFSGLGALGAAENFSSLNAYVYDKGQGSRSRGGSLLEQSAAIYNAAGALLSRANSYILYNPAFYLFGNIYSKLGGIGRKLDMGSRATSIHTGETLTAENAQEDLNSKAALFGYKLDENSVQFWDPANRDKNARMDAIIGKLTSGPPYDPAVCVLPSINAISGNTLNLANQNCQIANSSNNTYPDGRVWYVPSSVVLSSDIEIKGKIYGKGTIIIDYGQAGTAVPTVKLSTSANDFSPEGSSLGLILVNGGQVEFGSDCAMYKGIVFVPGDKNNSSSGSIIFAEGDQAQRMKIFGSIVADKIKFAGRGGGNGDYSVAIYSDSQILNSPPPGFREVAEVVGAK